MTLDPGVHSVESANTLVVEARLKGSGMHWDRASVSPMACLRDLLRSDRWTTAWPITRRAHWAAARRRPRSTPDARPTPAPPPPTATPATTPQPAPPPPPDAAPRVVDGRPTKDHSWRKPFFRSRQRQPLPAKS